MINIVLVEPEIPQNTGNIARTCAVTGTRLHLVRPLGFDISEKAVKRAGLDYWHLLDVRVYDSIDEFLELNGDKDLWLTSTKAENRYTEAAFKDDCYILFGKETAGLPAWLRERYISKCIRLPMISEARSLNLANTVAVICYEALRQQDFKGLK
jgi:tRNA (cytidine/uridine-2'-O-)-methyltransferase